MQLSDFDMPDIPFDEFELRNGDGRAAATPIRRSIAGTPKKRKPAPAPAEATVADLLMQAVKLAIARHGRTPRDVALREETLLEVLQSAMRRAE